LGGVADEKKAAAEFAHRSAIRFLVHRSGSVNGLIGRIRVRSGDAGEGIHAQGVNKVLHKLMP
jgi:hypothetical protein